ncbi:hypothetical protein [Roseimicrobium sp. ORNL1]|uniref:hypothetical protein n=1 Tax=Roseimicrobium sp. ORNL1 TaxID=2711231 RepID=UPI0013E1AF2F|nr:hypothetical protein [Roseimicrobium sp. ORNL1]QIF04188.1 hypothetical protein G5S37_22565 [Roseimicrobium sp. ORNL1]
MKSAFHPTLLAMVCMLGTSSAAWQRLPSADAPINLANQAILGAKIQSSASIGNSSALLNEGSMEAAKVPSGASHVVITLGAQEVVEDVSFINEGVSGSVTVSSSTDNSQWVSLAQAGFDAGERLVSLRFAGAQAKYVKLSFNASNGASIRNLSISGPSKVSDYKAVPVKEKGTEVDLASASSGAKPIYMYPTPTNVGDNEGARQTFKFPKTTERFRTVVYDLGTARVIKKFSAAYSRVPTRLDVFAFEQLPEKKDWRGKLTLDPSIFDTTPIIASGEDSVGKGLMQLTPKQPVKARYVALRFEPNFDKRGVAGVSPEWEAVAMSVVVPYANALKELGLMDGPTYTQAPQSTAEGFESIKIACAGGSQLVLISKAAIAQVQSQLGPNATEQDAINAILAAAGLTPASTPGENGTNGTNGTNGDEDDGDNGSGSVIGDPNAPLNPASLSALGLSAYRGGGTGGSGPFQAPPADDDDDNQGGGGNNGNGPPIIIVPSPNPPPTSP